MTDTSGLPQVTDITPLVTESALDGQDMIDTLRRIADKLGHDLVDRTGQAQEASEKVIRL